MECDPQNKEMSQEGGVAFHNRRLSSQGNGVSTARGKAIPIAIRAPLLRPVSLGIENPRKSP